MEGAQIMDLKQLAAKYPQTQEARERAEMAATAAGIADRQESIERAQRLKESLLRGLEGGTEPQTLLYMAISGIAAATFDGEFEARAHGYLDAISADLAQQSMFVDEKAVEAQRRQTIQADFNEKMRRQLLRQMKGYRQIMDGLQTALDAINAEQAAEAPADEQ